MARALSQYPQVVPHLLSGALTLCSLAVLAPKLSSETCDGLISSALGKSRRQVEDLVGAKAVKGGRDIIRPLFADFDAAVVQIPVVALGTPAEPTIALEVTVGAVPAPVLSPAKVRLSFTARAALVDNLKRLQEILGSADMDETFYRATEALLEKVDPERRHARRIEKSQSKSKAKAGTKRPSATLSHHIPKPLADAVMVRDGSQCTFTVNGKRCPARKFLHIDHIEHSLWVEIRSWKISAAFARRITWIGRVGHSVTFR